MADLTGLSLGRYHLIERLGEGGMAVVYKAYDTQLEREVALKVIRTERLAPNLMTRTIKRFEREAKALAQLNHPNIVPITEYGEQDGTPYFVMPHLTGGTLKQQLGRPIPWQEAARQLAPIARALEHAHQHNIIHRDVKPSNILITRSGEPMLTDFGIAKVLEAEETLDLTGTGVGIGTPEYMAPEQGFSHSLDARMDIYALGTVFYEMLTGRRPYEADTPLAVLIMKKTEPLPRPASYVKDLPREVEYFLLKALVVDPDNRFQTMGEMAALLEKFAQGKLPAIKQPEVEKTITTPIKQRKNWTLWLAGGLTGFVCLAVVVVGAVIVVDRMGTASEGLTDQKSSGITEIPMDESEQLPLPGITPTFTITLEPPTDTPTPAQGIEHVSTVDGMTMVFVPAGEFPMGAEDSRFDQSRPVHTVYLDDFWIDKTEVTNGMFTLFVSKTGYVGEMEQQGITWFYDGTWYSQGGAGWRNPFGPGSSLQGREDFPVIQVTWNDARAYCEWAQRRLPTEAEWEKAARGPDGFLYPWGNTLPSGGLANYAGIFGDIMRVGSFPEYGSPYGALDMAGNVYEWVADYFSITYYASSPASNPSGPSSGKSRVMRGGSWQLEEQRLLTYEREASAAGYGNSNLGFRCALDADQ